MQKTLSKIIGTGIITSLLIVPSLAVNAQEATSTRKMPPVPPTLLQLQNRIKEDARLNQIKASSTVKQLQNRENNIEKIQNRIASTTASTTEKRNQQLEKMLQKQRDEMQKMKDRVANQEVKAIAVIENIAKRLGERMTVLKNKGVVMTEADTLFAAANTKIADAKIQADKIKTLLSQPIASSTDPILNPVKDLLAIIKVDLKDAQQKLTATIRSINNVRPKFEKATTTKEVRDNNSTSTATSTN